MYDHLSLDPYLVASITPADLDPENNVATWTPKSFCMAALDRFSGVVDEPVPYEHWG